MSGFQWAALLLLAANLVLGIARPRRRGAGAERAGALKERVDVLSLRIGEMATFAAPAGPPDAAGWRPAGSQEALARSAAFLRQRLRAGDYGLACVGEDGVPRFSDSKGHVFVLSFIAEAMDGLLDEIDRTVMLARILSEEDGGLWGFSPPAPRHDEAFRPFHVDADDSAYVIRTLRRLGVNRPPDRLERFYRPGEGLFVTFDGPGAPKLIAAPRLDGNFGAHPEVNFNVFLALAGTHLDRLINFQLVREAQDERGFWPSFFYPSSLFATLLALDLARESPGLGAEADRALAFIEAAQNSDGSWGIDGDPHETALAVCALAGSGAHEAALRRGVAHLLAAMAPDGSWRSAACIWQFHAGRGDVWRAYDRHGAYVTARCMTALRRAAAGR